MTTYILCAYKLSIFVQSFRKKVNITDADFHRGIENPVNAGILRPKRKKSARIMTTTNAHACFEIAHRAKIRDRERTCAARRMLKKERCLLPHTRAHTPRLTHVKRRVRSYIGAGTVYHMALFFKPPLCFRFSFIVLRSLSRAGRAGITRGKKRDSHNCTAPT